MQWSYGTGASNNVAHGLKEIEKALDYGSITNFLVLIPQFVSKSIEK
jgi:stalled ribosome rescue protein Dom34